jgi:hypothetical protein
MWVGVRTLARRDILALAVAGRTGVVPAPGQCHGSSPGPVGLWAASLAAVRLRKTKGSSVEKATSEGECCPN